MKFNGRRPFWAAFPAWGASPREFFQLLSPIRDPAVLHSLNSTVTRA